MLVTALVSHLEMSRLNAEAPWNISSMSVTAPVFHLDMSPLNCEPVNMKSMEITAPVFHLDMSPLNAEYMNILLMEITRDTSQSPITPYGLPVTSFDAANFGHDPSCVSPKHPPVHMMLNLPVAELKSLKSSLQLPTAAFKAALSAGANTACVPTSPVKSSK